MVGDVSATDLGDVAATFSVELVVDHMHGLFKTHGVKILFYCGFATNWCVMDRPAAIRDMAGRGYGCGFCATPRQVSSKVIPLTGC